MAWTFKSCWIFKCLNKSLKKDLLNLLNLFKYFWMLPCCRSLQSWGPQSRGAWTPICRSTIVYCQGNAPLKGCIWLLLIVNRLEYTLSGRTGSTLVRHTHGRLFEPRLMQQVLQFIGRVNTVHYVELRGYCP